MKVILAAACACVLAATIFVYAQAAAHRQDCLRTRQLGVERQEAGLISKGERCLAGLEE